MKHDDVSMIGVVSDTHGLLRPEVLSVLADCDLILHAGDVGDRSVLERLGSIADVVAVRGNTDLGAWGRTLGRTEAVAINGRWCFLLHDLMDLDLDPATAGFSLVIHGHLHEPRIEERRGVLFLNPGSAGPQRSGRPTTVARIRVESGIFQPEIVDLLAERSSE